jgi:valyl-tRNA synthetase
MREKLQKDLLHAENFLRQIESKLNNRNFTQNAAPEVVERERKKWADTHARKKLLEEQLQALESFV